MSKSKSKKRIAIFCCGCQTEVQARLTTGAEIYPHRADLKSLPFWKCDSCENYVGCHHKTKDRTRPLGNIPTAELRKARSHIHAILDPIWRQGRIERKQLYAMISERLGYEFHTGELRTIEESRDVWRIVKEISKEMERAQG